MAEELTANILEHGMADPSTRIVVRLEARGAELSLNISDAGAAFDPRMARFEGPNPERGGGAGLALILAWGRVEEYRRRKGRNRLRLGMTTR